MNRNADIFDADNIIKSRGEFDLASCFPRYEDRQSKVAYEYRNLRIFVSSCKCIGLFLRGRARKTSLFSNAGCLTVDCLSGKDFGCIVQEKKKSDRILLKRR